MNEGEVLKILKKIGQWEHMIASGPGGQGMQHRQTARALRINFEDLLKAASSREKELLRVVLGNKVNGSGDLVWRTGEKRSARDNEKILLERASVQILRTLMPHKTRYAKKEPKKIKSLLRKAAEKRLAEKKLLKKKKAERRWRSSE